MTTRHWLGSGALLAGLGVGLGAFGAHGLKERLSSEMLVIYQTGVFYHLIHALGIMLAALTADRLGLRGGLICGFFALGVLLFSGSLYVLAISGQRWLGMVTPFGGTAFLVGWGILAFGCFRAKPDV